MAGEDHGLMGEPELGVFPTGTKNAVVLGPFRLAFDAPGAEGYPVEFSGTDDGSAADRYLSLNEGQVRALTRELLHLVTGWNEKPHGDDGLTSCGASCCDGFRRGERLDAAP